MRLRTRSQALYLTVLPVVFLFLMMSISHASPEDTASKISQRVMSPFCEGVTLHDCSSDSAEALRVRIAEMAADGVSEEQIMDALIADYGPIRAAPTKSGSGLLAWLPPALGLIGAALVASLLVRNWVKLPQSSSDVPGPKIPPEGRTRLDAELSRWRNAT